MKRHGYVWNRHEEDDGSWVTSIGGRFHPRVRPYGGLYEVDIKIDIPREVVPDTKGARFLFRRDTLYVRLSPKKTMDAAILHAVDWVGGYAKNLSVEAVFADCVRYWPTVYPNKRAWLDHLFFVIGNGYDWLDGALIPLDQSHPLRRSRKDPLAEVLREFPELATILRRRQETLPVSSPLYPADKIYSKVFMVPDDVRPDWLQVAYEAALLLRDDGVRNEYNAGNPKLGAKAVRMLEQRFPQLKKQKDAS